MMLLLDGKYMHKAADFLCRYYNTNVLGIYFGNLPTIVCNDAETVKEALNTREFDGKPQQLLSQLRTPDFKIRGVFFTEGDLWHEQRRFMLRYLRDYGFGRRFEELELEQRDEFKMFIDIVKNGPKYEHEKVRVFGNRFSFRMVSSFISFRRCSSRKVASFYLPVVLHRIWQTVL